MVSNQTSLVCDVIPVWTGYIWGAQGGATFDICSLFLVTVPPFLAFYFGILYLMTTLEGQNNIVERFDKKVDSFNARVARIIRALKARDYPGQVVASLPDVPDLSEVPSFIAAYSAYTAKKRVEEKDAGTTFSSFALDSWERNGASTNLDRDGAGSGDTQYYAWAEPAQPRTTI
jgi:hypothetical protein